MYDAGDYGLTAVLMEDPGLLSTIEVLYKRYPEYFSDGISRQLVQLIIKLKAKKLSLDFEGTRELLIRQPILLG